MHFSRVNQLLVKHGSKYPEVRSSLSTNNVDFVKSSYVNHCSLLVISIAEIIYVQILSVCFCNLKCLSPLFINPLFLREDRKLKKLFLGAYLKYDLPTFPYQFIYLFIHQFLPSFRPSFSLLSTVGYCILSRCFVDCNFDNGMCGWKNHPLNSINWTRRKGRTPTANTGPNADHTSGKGL